MQAVHGHPYSKALQSKTGTNKGHSKQISETNSNKILSPAAIITLHAERRQVIDVGQHLLWKIDTKADNADKHQCPLKLLLQPTM